MTSKEEIISELKETYKCDDIYAEKLYNVMHRWITFCFDMYKKELKEKSEK